RMHFHNAARQIVHRGKHVNTVYAEERTIDDEVRIEEYIPVDRVVPCLAEKEIAAWFQPVDHLPYQIKWLLNKVQYAGEVNQVVEIIIRVIRELLGSLMQYTLCRQVLPGKADFAQRRFDPVAIIARLVKSQQLVAVATANIQYGSASGEKRFHPLQNQIVGL